MDLTLHPATHADLPVVRELASYYAYDMSEYLGGACSASGRFGSTEDLETYWTSPGRHALVLYAGNELAGFVLMRSSHEEADLDYSITDFFVLRKFRHHHLGERAARQLFDAHRGRWRIIEHEKNLPAVGFWRAVIGRYTGGHYSVSTRRSPWGTLNVISFRNDGEAGSAPATAPLLATPCQPVSSKSVERYDWGPGCEGWHLVRTDALSVIQERMDPQTREARHRHGRCRQFFYVLSGQLTIEVEGQTHDLPPGAGLEIPPTLAHQVFNHGEVSVTFLVVSQPPSHGDREPAPRPA